MRCDEEEVEEDECSEDDTVVRNRIRGIGGGGGGYPGTRIGVRAMLSFQFSPPRFL